MVRTLIKTSLVLLVCGLLQATPTNFGITGTFTPVRVSPVGFSGTVTACPNTWTLSTTTTGAHIFYVTDALGNATPTHTGDTATGSTIRIGSNSGSAASTGSSSGIRYMTAVAYLAGSPDSAITQKGVCCTAPLTCF